MFEVCQANSSTSKDHKQKYLIFHYYYFYIRRDKKEDKLMADEWT